MEEKIRKLFIFMVAVVLVLAVGCQNNTEAALTYEITEENTIRITGLSDESIKKLVIPEKIDGKPVMEIGKYAFYECENLKSVELPNVIKVDKAAFSGCKNLESVSMPKVETIADKAFFDCTKLTQVEFPEEVEISDTAFEGCNSLPVQLPTPTPINTEYLKNAQIGDYVVFGSYEQDGNTDNGTEEIEWLVLDKTEDRILVISKYILDYQGYHDTVDWEEDVTWETCTLRQWLNNEFFNTAFMANEQKLIPTVTVAAGDNPHYDTDAGNATQDKIFLLSYSETREYFDSYDARKCERTACLDKLGVQLQYWWLRTPGDEQNCAITIDARGSTWVDGSPATRFNGVRPAMWINLNY